MSASATNQTPAEVENIIDKYLTAVIAALQTQDCVELPLTSEALWLDEKAAPLCGKAIRL